MITILNLERWYFSTNHKSFTGARGRDGPVGKKPKKGGGIGYGFSSGRASDRQLSNRRGCELMLVALVQIYRCAEGRAMLVEHAAGLATVSKKIMRVSHVASDRAMRIVCLVCRFSATFRVP
ncbi:hypothetical protein L6452_02421 [Arctium lappa]|uniref:Uncharacterized protein n=1 Tax=Arctium lappa TaxID=4217 RepID=A0ACB9FJV9_ARCLA|nr:hypothetical protein L6452_02421 [Arctium lappa]